MFNKNFEATERLLITGIHTGISENEIAKELSQNYPGLKHVQRYYYDKELKDPKEVVAVTFKSKKYTEQILQDGNINIGNLRCQVKGLKPARVFQNDFHSENESDNQSETFNDTPQVTNKVLVHGVPEHIDTEELQELLHKTYSGIKYVKRWYYDDESRNPTKNVQIDFDLLENAENILQDGFINIGQLSYAVTALKPSKYFQRQIKMNSRSSNKTFIFTEEEVLHTFEEQKQ